MVSQMIHFFSKWSLFSGDIPSFSGGAWRFQWQGQGCLEDTPVKLHGKSHEKRNKKGRIQILLSPVGECSKTCLLFVCLFVCFGMFTQR